MGKIYNHKCRDTNELIINMTEAERVIRANVSPENIQELYSYNPTTGESSIIPGAYRVQMHLAELVNLMNNFAQSEIQKEASRTRSNY